jgi:hypothetical protein
METFLRVAGFIVGVIILGSTAASVFTALVVPRATSSGAQRAVARALGKTTRRLLPHLPSYAVRDRVMAFVGPVAMLTLFVVWLGALVVGFGLVTWWPSGESLGAALGIGGSSVFTLGIVTGHGSGPRAIEIIAAGVGLLVVALEIAYLPALYAALGSRDPGPPPGAGQPQRASPALRRLGALGRRGLRESHQLSRAHLVPFAGAFA